MRRSRTFGFLAVAWLVALGAFDTYGAEPLPANAGADLPSHLRNLRWVKYQLPREGAKYPTVYRMRSGRDLLAAHGGGLWRYRPLSREWVEVLVGEERGAGNVVTAPRFCETSEGAVWLETNRGLVAYCPHETTVFGRDEMEPEDERSVLSVVFLPLEILGGVLNLFFGPGDRLKVTSFCEEETGELWFGTEGHGLLHYTPMTTEGVRPGTQWRRYTKAETDLPSDYVTVLATGPGETLWVGTDDGLVVWQDGSRVPRPTIDREVSGKVSFVQKTGEGQVWVGTEDPDGLFIVVGPSGLRDLTRQARRSQPGKHLAYDMPRVTSGGDLWVRRTLWRESDGLFPGPQRSKRAGLLRVVHPEGDPLFEVYTSQGAFGESRGDVSGELLDDQVVDLAEDSEGRIWVVTEKGVSVFDAVGQRWTVVLSASGGTLIPGPAPPRAKVRSISVAEDGSVWFGGEHALYGLQSRTSQPVGE